MKILHINTVCGKGSTGTIAVDIANRAIAAGYKVFIAYGQGSTSFPNSYKIGSKIENLFHNLFFSRILGLQGYGTIWGTWRFLRWVNKFKPDIIHIHNLHGNYINHPMLFKYLIKNKIPITITLHDCYNLTGKCAHFTNAKCEKWENQCFDCPIYKKTTAPSYFFDNSRFLFGQKKNWFNQLTQIKVIAVSKWLEGVAKKSILNGANSSISYIYNWVTPDKFTTNPSSLNLVYEKYGLSKKINYVLSVGAGWDNRSSKYTDAVRLASILPNTYKLIIVGQKLHSTQFPQNIIHIPYVSDPRELAAIYSIAIAYVHLSIEDTFGKVIAEAMLCGTPAIVFNSTACPEIVGNTGFIVPPHDVKAMLDAILTINQNGKGSYSKKTIEYVKTHYDTEKNIGEYINIYNSFFDQASN